MVNRFKTADLGQIISIVNQVGPMVTTNLKKDEITSLVANSLTYLNYEVVQNYVPKEGLWYYNNPNDESWDIAGSCILIADMAAQRKALANFIYEMDGPEEGATAVSSQPTTAQGLTQEQTQAQTSSQTSAQ